MRSSTPPATRGELGHTLPPLSRSGRVPASVPAGTVVDHWDCPACDRTIAIVHRPGRPRLYCSHACRQRAYRWRRRHEAHTAGTPSWPAQTAHVDRRQGARAHALRDDRDPLARRRDRRGRRPTVCGLMARPASPTTPPHYPTPFLTADDEACTTCRTLIQPRPLGLVPGPPPPAPSRQRLAPGQPDPAIASLHEIDPAWPLEPKIRMLLDGLWSLTPPVTNGRRRRRPQPRERLQ